MLLSEMEAADSNQDDLIKRVEIVDTLECLGIDRHFQHEIKTAALDYVYRLRISRHLNYNVALTNIILVTGYSIVQKHDCI